MKIFPNFTQKTTSGTNPGTGTVVPVIHYALKDDIPPSALSTGPIINNLLLDDDCKSKLFNRPVSIYRKTPPSWTESNANGISNKAVYNQWYSLRQMIKEGQFVKMIPAIVGIDKGPNGAGEITFMCVATWYLHFRHGASGIAPDP
jgi:hypothetical protein